jgi:hypothetical protein
LVAKLQHADPVSILDKRAAGTTEVKLRADTTDNLTVAASFATTAACSIEKAFIRAKRGGTIASGKFIKLEVFSDSTGDPDAAVAAATTIDPTSISTAYDYVGFTFPSLVDLAASTTYHFALSGDYTVHGTNCVILSATTLASGGRLSLYGSSWAPVATQSPNMWGTGYRWADEKAWTVAASAVLSAHSPANIDYLSKSVRGRLEVTAGDGSTKYHAGLAVIAQREQG